MDCFVDLKRLGSALVAQNSRSAADINDIFGCKWRQQRPLRPLRRSAVLRHATSIARVREDAAYGLSHYSHPWSCKWRQQRLLRPLQRSVVLRHATSIARIRENAAYGLSHYPHPWGR